MMLMRRTGTKTERSSRQMDSIDAVGAETRMRGFRVAAGRNMTPALMKRTAL